MVLYKGFLKSQFIFAFTFLSFFSPTLASAWGERGHHTICEVAASLVEEKELKEFLMQKSHMLGHVCNIPDIYWRELEEPVKNDLEKLEAMPNKSVETSRKIASDKDQLEQFRLMNTSHFIELDGHGIALEKAPLSFTEVAKIGAPTEIGSSWWRTQQFFDLILSTGKEARQANDTHNHHKFSAAVKSMLVNMGLMGHFVGDIAQPLHNTADYDGWETGNGGLHSYYESECVNRLPLSLVNDVFQAAQDPKRTGLSFVSVKNSAEVLVRMRDLSAKSYAEIKLLKAIDDKDVILPGKQNRSVSPRDLNKAIPAQRVAAAVAAQKYQDLIVTEFARAAKLLALLWDDAFREAGKPPLAKYHSYDYPLTPGPVFINYKLD